MMNRGLSVRMFVSTAFVLGFAACSGSDGKDGKTCTIHLNDAGANVMVCPDGTTAILGGYDASVVVPAATNCTISSPDGGVKKIICPDGTEVVLPSTPAASTAAACIVVSNGDGTSSMTCPGGDGGMITVTVKTALVNYANLSADGKAALDLKVAVTSVTVPASGKPVIAFRASDKATSNAVAGLPPADFRFGLLKLVPAPAAAGGNDTWVSYMAANATSVAGTETAAAVASATSGALTDNGDGTYSYTFVKNVADPANAGTTYEPTLTHRLSMLIYESGNPFAPVNVVKDFVPATGLDVTGKAENVDGATCLNCHSSFRAKAGGVGPFHNGTRYDLKVCVTCHNDQRRFTPMPGTGTTPAVNLDSPGAVSVDPATGTASWTGAATVVNGEAVINLPVFIHRIHMGDQLKLTGGSYTAISKPYEITYPQDVRNCVKCHTNSPQADNFKTKPSRRACGSCHDDKSFATTAALPAGRTQHAGGDMADDTLCSTCHPATKAKSKAGIGVIDSHIAVADPDPTATNFGGTNTHTNAGWIPAAGVTPAGAAKIIYNIKSVSRDASKHPSIVFQFKKYVPPALPAAATPVVFNDPAAATEMIPGFVNSPSVYFVYAIPQDGIKAPADFNASASAWIKTIWNGTAATTGTMSGPDASGFYTITLAATVPDSAVMLTGGIGYTYGTTSTQPLTEIDLPAYPYGDATLVPGCVAGQVCGGLIVPTDDASVVATGYTARRAIVNNTTCIKCHEQLGATPSFHAGQRNDAATCSWCHNPNKANGGWSVSSSTFVHGIHGGSERTVPFTWQATCPAGTSVAAGTCTAANADSYAKVTYPGILKNCTQCHLPGTYDFSASASAAALPNLLMSTVAVNPSATTLIAAGITTAPYVTPGTDYGLGFTTSGSITTGTVNGVACTTAAPCVCTLAAPCNASDSTLVKSPITAACSTCHDSPEYVAHMKQMGGTFYGTRLAAKATDEMCMMCHGPGTVAAIADVHK